MNIDKTKFDQVKLEAEKFYKSIDEVHCPYFNETISFNTKGLEHIKFKERGKARVVVDQYVRLKLLQLVPKIIKKSHTLQEFFETKRFEQVKSSSKWNKKLVKVMYYGFVAIINGARIKIIIKEIEGGNKHFWSIIPFWKMNQKNSGNKKILHAGDMEND